MCIIYHRINFPSFPCWIMFFNKEQNEHENKWKTHILIVPVRNITNWPLIQWDCSIKTLCHHYVCKSVRCWNISRNHSIAHSAQFEYGGHVDVRYGEYFTSQQFISPSNLRSRAVLMRFSALYCSDSAKWQWWLVRSLLLSTVRHLFSLRIPR